MALSVFTVLPVGVSAAEADTATSAYNSDNDYSSISYGTVYNPRDSYTVDANTPYTEDAIVACGGLLSDTQKIYFQAPEDWANEYNTFPGPDLPNDEPYMHVCIYWWSGIAGSSNYGWPSGKGCVWVGYQAHLVDKKNRIYRALVPADGSTPRVIWNNGVNGGMDPSKEIFNLTHYLADANIEGANPGDYDTLPEGTPNEENMDNCIAIINYDPDGAQENPLTHIWNYGSDWYVYYGDGCYGEYPMDSPNFHTIADNCINPNHNHQCTHESTYTYKENSQYFDWGYTYDEVTYCNNCDMIISRENKQSNYADSGMIFFDATSAGWEDASRIYFYIYEINENGHSEELVPWGSKRLSGTYLGNGKWEYDAAGVGVEPGKQYCLIVSNYYTGAQCYDLVMDSSCFGDTAYVTGDHIENPVDSNKYTIEAKWKNSSLGPRKQITSIGNVVGETVPTATTPYKIFVDFLRNTLDIALRYSGKDEQCLIDDTAKALELNKNDVEKAIREAGARVYWSYSDSTVPLPAPVDIPDEDGLILFDARSAGWEDADAIMFDIYDLNDNRLPAESTPDEIRGTESHDGVWFFNAKDRGVQDGQLYYIVFWNDNTHEHTAQLLLDSSCYGDKAVCDGLMASELYVDYRPYYSTSGASSSGSSSAGSSGSSFGTPWFSYPDYVSYPAVSWNNQHSFSANGTIGDLTWAIKNGVLTISGNGPLENDDKIKKIWDKLKFTKAVIQNGVTSIGDRVFDGCYSLESLTIGNAVTSIGERAFKDCKNLESVSIGGSVKSISRYAFYRCVGLKTAVIGNSVTSIGNSAFYQCSDLTSVTIGNSVTKIDKYTFEDCDNLKNVTLGNSIYGIAAGAFYDCDNLESIILPDSVQIIADKAFSDCISLSSVTIPESVTDIGEKAFYNCPSLKNVTVPDSATNIDTKAFGYYYNNEFGITMRVPGFRLYGSVNSEAHRYAKAYGFRFERAVAMTGDADGDLMITVMDVTEVQRSLSSLSTTSDEDITRYADVDHNNVLEVIDATYILRYVGEKEIPYDIGQIQD